MLTARVPIRVRSVAVLVCWMGCFLSCPAQTPAGQGSNQSSADDLSGLWASEQILRPVARGELVIDSRGGTWRARIAGFEVAVEKKGDGIHFALPTGTGEFRGHLAPGSRKIWGHWIQPGGVFPYAQRYASPVELQAVEAGVWQGQVIPLEPSISLYLSIQAAAEGSLTAFLRNPEANLFGRRSYRVERKGGDIVLSDGNQQLQGAYDAEARRLSFSLLNDYPPLAFTRRPDGAAIGLLPRMPAGAGKYAYQKPLAENDGWSTASLAEVGLDVQPISALIEKILNAVPSRDNPVNIHSLLIARHGKLVLEEYFYGFHKDRPHDMRSASKTFAPLLIGLARENGANISVDAPVESFFPEYKPFGHPDERKSRITVRHLMTMTSGLNCRGQWDEDPMQQQTEQPDWYKFTLDMPMARDPGGEQANYCSADTNLLGGIVRKATGQWLPEFFDQHVARPLQMRPFHMNLMPTEDGYLGGGLYLRPRDQLKLGQLYLSGGMWNGRRIISRRWAQDSVARHAQFQPIFDIDAGHGYGYGWHVRDHKAGGRVFHDYYAGGNGGQLIIVVPELDMVVGFTGGDYGEARKFFRWEVELLPQYIIPAALKQAGSGPHRP